MAKLNWLVQRAVKADAHAEYLAVGKVWVDCGPGYVKQVNDAYGNAGYQDIERARDCLATMRKRFPNDKYRLIRIAV